MLRKFALVLLVALAVFAVVVMFQPDSFRIARSTRVEASASDAYVMINDFRNWEGWSPWARLDPEMKKTLSGPTRGKGAVYAWSGNDKVGEGRMEIVESVKNERVTIDLHFVSPFEARNVTEFTIAPEQSGDAVQVTWAMSGKNGTMSKIFGLFMDVDKLLGEDFEKGLADLKRLAEARAKAHHRAPSAN